MLLKLFILGISFPMRLLKMFSNKVKSMSFLLDRKWVIKFHFIFVYIYYYVYNMIIYCLIIVSLSLWHSFMDEFMIELISPNPRLCIKLNWLLLYVWLSYCIYTIIWCFYVDSWMNMAVLVVISLRRFAKVNW